MSAATGGDRRGGVAETAADVGGEVAPALSLALPVVYIRDKGCFDRSPLQTFARRNSVQWMPPPG